MMKSEQHIEDIWLRPAVFRCAFEECLECFDFVTDKAREITISPEGTPQEFSVTLGEFPEEFRSIRRHLFSVLFQSMYSVLGLSWEKRLLYGKLNYLFRIWVTSADNLLDNEDKLTLPICMTGRGHIMKPVISIMAADRVLQVMLHETLRSGLLTFEQVEVLSRQSLQALLPSAAEESSEEGGIQTRRTPEDILKKIHVLKTGILFNLPFVGPKHIEPGLDRALIKSLELALMNFGVGCQVLDDIRDMSLDLKENRQNYVLSSIFHQDPATYEGRLKDLKSMPESLRGCPAIFDRFIVPAAQLGRTLLLKGLSQLSECGITLTVEEREEIAESMFFVLALGDPQQWLTPFKAHRLL